MHHQQIRSSRSLTFLCVVGFGAIASCTPPPAQGPDPSANRPIPRFPPQGIPSSSTAPSSPSSTPAQAGPDATDPNPPGSSTPPPDTPTPEFEKSSSAPSPSSSPELVTSSPSTTTSSAPSDSIPQPGPKSAPYVDAAYIKVIVEQDGSVYESFKWESPEGEHEYMRIGNRRAKQQDQYINLIRRSYLIFDVSKIQNAQRAEIQLFLFAKSRTTNNYGGVDGPDPFETAQVHAVERHTPQSIIDAPFNDTQNHRFDLPLFEDLADGPLYASLNIKKEDFEPQHLAPTPNASPRRQNCNDLVERACGRWFRFKLNAQAVEAINQTNGLWATGWSLSSIDHAKGVTSDTVEWLFVGGFFDLAPTRAIFPDYLGPKPRLIIDP